MDATFAPLSTYFFGNKRNKINGKNIETLDQSVMGMKEAYTNRRDGGVLGGKPKISQLGFAYDFTQFIEPFMDENFGGWGHSTMEWLDTDGARVSGKRGSAIHFLHFFQVFSLAIPFLPDPRGAGLHQAFQKWAI